MQGGGEGYAATKDIRKACNNCIKAKAACDHNRPCLRCVSHKLADSCANVPRKANKRRVLDDHSHSSCPCQSTASNLSCMLNTSLNNIINNLNTSNNNNNNNTNNGPSNYLAQHATGGEITGNIMASNIINTAVHNLYNNNSISSLSDSMDTQMDYESAVHWLQGTPSFTSPSSPAFPHSHIPPHNTNNDTNNIKNTSNNNSSLNNNNNNNNDNTTNINGNSNNVKYISPITSASSQPNHPVPSSSQQPTVSSPPLSHSTACSPPFNATASSSSSSITNPHTPSSPPLPLTYSTPASHSLTLPDAPHQVPPLPTLNITIYTKTVNHPSPPQTPSHNTYISDLLKFSPLQQSSGVGVSGSGSGGGSDEQQQQQQQPSHTVHPHNISIPNCSAESLVQTISLLSKYAAIDFDSPVHIEYEYQSVPFTVPPVGLVETSGPTLVDCNEPFATFCGFSGIEEAVHQNRPISDFILPEGWVWARRSIELLTKYNMPYIERYHVFLLRGRPARVFLTQHKLVGYHHRTITFLEEYPDFPLCFFVDWIKKILPNAVLPPCSRPYCHCKYPDE